MGEMSEVLVMYLLSLWKIYIAYGYFAFESYSFLISSVIVLSAVISSNLLCYFFYAQLKNSVWYSKFMRSKTYLKGAKVYNKYGFYPSAVLAPVLLGIPTFCLVSFAFGVSNKKVVSALVVSSLLWGAIINITFYYSIALL